MKVAVLGVTGETGGSIVEALLTSSHEFTVTALVRPSSTEKPKVHALKARGVRIVPLDLDAPHEDIVKALVGQQVVISCLIPLSTTTQIALADAAKAAQVERFLPSAFAIVCSSPDVLILQQIVLEYVQKIGLPWTTIDVGWWYQNSLPRLPSGKIDYAVTFPMNQIAGSGSVPTALTDIRDIGKYVARIIVDTRTLNHAVFAYNEVLTQHEIFALLESVSGEKVPREYQTTQQISDTISAAQQRYETDQSVGNLLGLASVQYSDIMWLRGDNIPGKASEQGYSDGKELYPDQQFMRYKDYIEELTTGKGKGVYQDVHFDFIQK